MVCAHAAIAGPVPLRVAGGISHLTAVKDEGIFNDTLDDNDRARVSAAQLPRPLPTLAPQIP